jgi:preprotein translocase subunit SecG
MQIVLLIIHVLAAIAIITLVLLQHGKGADVGATFGSGGSQTMFGSQGPMSFLMKLTSILAAIFFITSLTLNYLGSRSVAHSNGLNFPKQNSTLPKPNS